MASEVIKLNLIPKGEMPVFHASQFDTGRLITCELYRGEDAYDVPAGYTVELHCRKVDNNIVTMASTLINDNVVTFTSTEQLTACNGNNLCEVAILDEGYRIGTLNFILEVEVDPLKGGINSTSEIHDLYEQVEDITTEVIGDDYYNKTQVDDLLDTKADKSDTYTKTQVDTLLTSKADKSNTYTKSETDTLLSAKADSDDVYTKGQVETKLAAKADAADVYTKGQVDTALALKANAADVYTKGQVDTALSAKADADTTTAALATKADKSDTYTKEQVDALIDSIFPTLTASGAIATFTTALTKPLVSVTAAAGATTITRCGVNLINISDLATTGITYSSGDLSGTAGAFNTAYDNGYDSGHGFNANTQYTVSMKAYTEGNASTSGNGLRVGFIYTDGTKNYQNITNDTTTEITVSYTSTLGKTVKAIYFTYGSASNNIWHISDFILAEGTTATYSPYTGNTVPIADATTLVTESGVNNVYTDSGDVTVQYKYMSM